MGPSWEGLVVEEVLRQLGTLGVGHDASYYRTSAGAEVDLVLEGTFGLVAVEVKHNSTVSARELRGVKDFVREQKARLGLVITNDTTARLLDDRLVSLPFSWL